MIDSAPADERVCGDADVARMRAVLRTARTAPWVALAEVDAAAAGSVARLRGRCARLAAGAAAGVAHRACPPSVLRARSADVSGDAGGVVDAHGSAGWQARSLDLGGLAVAAHRLRRDAGHSDSATRVAALRSSAVPTVMLWPAVFDDDIGANIAAVSNPACPAGCCGLLRRCLGCCWSQRWRPTRRCRRICSNVSYPGTFLRDSGIHDGNRRADGGLVWVRGRVRAAGSTAARAPRRLRCLRWLCTRTARSC